MVNMDDMYSMASGVGKLRQSNSQGYYGSRPPPSSNDRMSQQQPQQRTAASSSSGNSYMAQNRNDPEWKNRVRHNQQRLFLLHHSAKCAHEDGRCPVTPHCGAMKRLLRHMRGCKDNHYRVSHCFSLRAILSHYRKCKDTNCPACGPARDMVQRSRESTPTAGSTNDPMKNAIMGRKGNGKPYLMSKL
jgi:E1A/CREB-binding protein